MCGIFGGHEGVINDNARHVLRHRGPDQQGSIIVEDAQGRRFEFGMTRLSIVDRRPMDVPYSRDGATICFNGEIYNWRLVRAELENNGWSFQTETDTELALVAFLAWGERCLDKFNGQFAIAIWRDGVVWLARDRMGKKPIFYWHHHGEFAFASELKAFMRLELSPVDICQRLEFYFNEHTPFQHIYSVPPGCWLSWRAGSAPKVQRWWKFPEYDGSIICLDKAVDEFLEIFRDSCRIRQVADVPVTLFLSGGYDSALIQAICRMDKTFTIQFEEFVRTINEEDLVLDYAEKMGFDAQIVRPTEAEFLEKIPDLARAIEFPVGSFSIYPLYMLAAATRNEGFVVALSGEGSDELFNGYYRNALMLEEQERILKHNSGDYKHLSAHYFSDEKHRLARMASRHSQADIEPLIGLFDTFWDPAAPFCHNMSVFESTIAIQPLLTMADRMSMANSLEVRNPFLDYRIVDFSVKLAPSLRCQDGHGKLVVRAALDRLSQEFGRLKLQDRRFKHGLPAPVNQWLFHLEKLDRSMWNDFMLSECVRQLKLIQKQSIPKGVNTPMVS